MSKHDWIEKCNHWKNKWQVIDPSYISESDFGSLNLYAVLDAVNKYSHPEDIIMGDAGSISYAGPTALKAKAGQKFIFSPAQADMGWALPASIGVALASKQPVIAIIGDGSFMSNLQELATVRKHNLNIKFIVLDNDGYLSIKNTQTKYYDGRVYGTSSSNGLWFPELEKVADTFEMDWKYVNSLEDLANFDDTLHSSRRPSIIQCKCMSNQEILPAQALKNGKQAGLHDMAPFLSDEELASEMVVKLK